MNPKGYRRADGRRTYRQRLGDGRAGSGDVRAGDEGGYQQAVKDARAEVPDLGGDSAGMEWWSGWEGRSLRAEGQPKGIVVGTQAAG